MMKICVWRYLENEKNYPGYNLSADSEGCAYIKDRLNDQWAKSSIPLTPPDDAVLSVPNNMEGRARISYASKLKVDVDESADNEFMIISEHKGIVTVRISSMMKEKFLTGIQDIERGSGDYALRSDTNSIWFWWHPTANGI